MLKEYKRFWNKDRLAKASALKMTPSEVMTLASIVQKETAKTRLLGASVVSISRSRTSPWMLGIWSYPEGNYGI